jgi:ABC-type transport system involved in multi-copper enzyme maturation permease subunit
MTTLASSPPTGVSAPAIRRTSFARLAVVELRKSVDTRAGAVLLGLAALLTLAPVAWQLTHLDHGVPDFGLWASTARGGVSLLVPVIGILAMTGEWSQRTALTTFTLVPRRGRVVTAKLVAAAVLGAATMVFALGVAALALVVAAAGHDVSPQWGDVGRVVAGSLVSSGLNLLMGAAFGALLAHTAVALVVFFVAPTLWGVAGTALLRDNARWLDVSSAFGDLSDLGTAGHGGQIATAVAVWVGLPLALGTWRALRRDVS